MFKNAEFFVHKYIKNEINYKEVVGLMQGKQQQDFRTEKYIRYGIRKYSFGAASVAIAAGLMFLGNGAVSATEVQGAETPVAAATAPANQADSNKEKEAVKPETEKVAEVKPEVKAEEAKKVNKAILEASIATLESKLSTAKYADATVVSSAKEVLAAAKATLAKADASQADVDAQAETVSALSTVVTESNTAGFDKKKAAEKEVSKAEAEKKATPAEKTLSEAKSGLDKASSEADVTNRLAKSELSKKEVKEENKAAVEAAVAKNQAVLAETKTLLADKSVTKEQVDAQLARLNESILAVYNELKNAGIGRDGKFAVNLEDAQTTALKDSSTEAGQKWLADHGYSSLADIPIMNKGKDDKEIEQASKQIQWLDFTDTAAWTSLDADGQLQVGSTFKKELMPGYVVTLTVKEMKPFHATETYKNRVAGTASEDTYNPDAVNSFKQATGIGGSAQTKWAHVKNAGFNTDPHKTTIAGTDDKSVQKNGTIAGVVFSVDAEYNGKKTKPTILMTSGEDIKVNESEIYTTNGTPWDLYALVGNASETTPYQPNVKMKNVTSPQEFSPADDKLQKALANSAFSTPDTATAGLGSQVFGSYINGEKGGSATPIVSTAGATEVGFYIISGGAQSSMIGISLSDFGDLPESYGKAEHSLRTSTTDYATGQKEEIQQPYLGKVKADPEAQNGERVRGIGSDDATDNADEGVAQLIAEKDVHINKDNGEPEVKIVQAADNSYRVRVIASANGNDNYTGTVEPAYVRGFIDFNNNGKFDEGEASEIVKVTGNNETVELVFKNTQVIDTTKGVVNFRTRIAKSEKQVTKATGIAFSGEVEDNQIQVAIPPRGDKEETTGKQGETQSVGIEFVSRALGDDASNLGSNNGNTTFNSYGKLDYSEQPNSISLETTKKKQSEGVMIVDPEGNLVKSYTKAGQGTYTVLEDKVTFTPEPNFVGKADGIVLRAVDANGHSTGWTALTDQHGVENINEGSHTTATKTMDAVYIPTVTPKEITAAPEESTDVQGKEQKKTPTFKTEGDSATPVTPSAQYPAKLVDPTTGQPTDATSVTVEGQGTYTINPTTGEVTFQPLPTFTGTASGVGVSLTAPVGQDKDGNPVTATATTTYTPTVTAVTPTADPATSAGVQGETQKGTPTFTEGNTEVPIKENSVKLLNPDGTEATGPVDALDPSGKKVGEYTVNPATGEVTFTPTDKTYTGKVTPAKVQAEDKNGTKVSTTYTPTIVGVTPTADPAKSVDIQGATQENTVSFEPGKTTIAGEEKTVEIDPSTYTLLGEDGQPATEVPAKDPNGKVIGKYTLKTVDGKAVAVFEPTDKTYSGEVQPVKIQAKDKNGTAVETTYTPLITPVTPTAEPAETTDIQGKEQTGKPTFTPGNPNVPMDDDTPATFEDGSKEKVIPGEGTYTVEPDGTVKFTPEKGFTGKGTGVTVKRVDKNGTPVTAKYTPTVTPVTPTGTDAVTEDVQGSTQTGKPTFEGGKVTVNGEEKTVEIDEDKPAKLVDPKTGDPVDSVTIEGEGTYTVSPDGTVTFTPEKNFTGKGTGVTVQREDKNGTPVKATYTPVVKPATPTSSDVITTNVQGATQSGTPTFEGGKVTVNGEEKTVEIDETVKPTFDDGTTEKKVPGEGTYTIDENGTVTFTPEKNFTGQATGVTVKRVDKNGTPITAKYTPVVVPVTPTSKDTESEGPKGQPQSGTPTFEGGKVTINGKEVPVEIDETVKPTFDDGTTEKKVPGEGTYTIDENGKVTFTPEPDFVGKAKGVTVKRVDKNGTPVTATYTPTVRPDTSFVDKDGNPLSPTEDGTKPTKDIPGYKIVKTEIDEKGNTKHIYEKVTTTYKDKDGNVIPNYPTEDGEQPKKDIPGYRFVETKKLPNGDTEHVYEKVKTSFKDKEGNEIPGNPSEDGDQPKKDIPGYRFVETKKLPNGDVEHVYEKVKTSHKDKDGNEIPNYPTEDGDQPKKDIPGYRFVETKKLPNGDIEHVYEKVKTSFKDKEGNEIPGNPSEDGEQPKKDIPGYRFVETKKLPNGDVEHVYEKVSTPAPTPTPTPSTPVYEKVLTTYVDENGELIIPNEDGSHPRKSLEGYELVRTETDANGNVRNVYRKIQSQKPVQPVEPATPAMPEQPAKPQVPATPAQPVQPTAVKEAEGKRELPNTGTEDHASLAALGLLGVLSGFGLVARKKKED